jgi:16S rRNA (uracil1498-N3)-methyltransferase
MKLHRFIGDFDLSSSVVVSRDIELINQIKNVLHLPVGRQVVLFVGDGREVVASIEMINKNEVIFKILEQSKNEKESQRDVTLFCSILKKENFELVCQKATECGVKRIVPLISDRTIKTGLKKERLEKIVKEASEQSGRALIPEMGEACSLKEALAFSKGEVKIFFDASGEDLPLKIDGEKIAIFIGPEGGWTDKELLLAKEYSCSVAKLGNFILRGETAAIVASYLAVNNNS